MSFSTAGRRLEMRLLAVAAVFPSIGFSLHLRSAKRITFPSHALVGRQTCRQCKRHCCRLYRRNVPPSPSPVADVILSKICDDWGVRHFESGQRRQFPKRPTSSCVRPDRGFVPSASYADRFAMPTSFRFPSQRTSHRQSIYNEHARAAQPCVGSWEWERPRSRCSCYYCSLVLRWR